MGMGHSCLNITTSDHKRNSSADDMHLSLGLTQHQVFGYTNTIQYGECATQRPQPHPASLYFIQLPLCPPVSDTHKDKKNKILGCFDQTFHTTNYPFLIYTLMDKNNQRETIRISLLHWGSCVLHNMIQAKLT